MMMTITSGGSRGGARGGPPLFLDQSVAQRAEKFFGDRPAPPPPLSKGLDPALMTKSNSFF